MSAKKPFERSGGRLEFEDETPEHLSSVLSVMLWDASRTIGMLAGVIVLVVVLALLFKHEWHLREGIDAILPERIIRPLSDDESIRTVEEYKRKAVDTASKAGQEVALTPRRDSFGPGATKAEVLKAQGTPDQMGTEVWRYGSSEVSFAQGRVVGWRSSPANPLKVSQSLSTAP